MSNLKKQAELAHLRHLVPICELTQENMQDLAGKTYHEQLPKGRTLFKKGDVDNVSYYVLSGEVTLLTEGGEKTIVGGTAASRFPLDHQRPHQATALAKSDLTFVRINNDLLDILLTWDQNAGYKVSEISAQEEQVDDNDWMTNMLRSELFHRIPPGNIQAVFMRMEPVPYRAGEVVIRQGEEGDYYYYIKQGRCLVTRSSAKTGKEIKLAELEAGASFGEEALIANTRRNANVTMLTDGVLMRLGKKDFDELLKAPILHVVDYEQALGMVERGAVWLDVRLESEYKNRHIPESINIPLYLLRFKVGGLDKSRKFVVYCDTGRRSASAAYLLNERGFDAYVLKGGMVNQKELTTTSQA